MQEAIVSTFSNAGGNVPVHSNIKHFVYNAGNGQDGNTQGRVSWASETVSPLLIVQGLDPEQLVDKSAAELAIRRLTHEINLARDEVKELEQILVRELLTPPTKEWLFPLMAIGLAFSLFGSIAAVNLAGLGAAGMMLLWSLSAFWIIYTGDKRLETSRSASQAELEIWSSRINELQYSLEQNRRIVEAAGH